MFSHIVKDYNKTLKAPKKSEPYACCKIRMFIHMVLGCTSFCGMTSVVEVIKRDI